VRDSLGQFFIFLCFGEFRVPVGYYGICGKSLILWVGGTFFLDV